MAANEQLKGHLDLLLLRVLADGPAHGYEVVVALRDRSKGTFDLPEGTVYPALHRLESQGLLASDWDTSGPRRRRVYRLTRDGHRSLDALRTDWQRFARGIGNVLGSVRSGGSVRVARLDGGAA
ncbi:MAG: helix-turn-helix transcriptional regulator [Frankiales bacterium]|nr:helix-turn-helix transcriptional regulator [Frankiales bacterium]